MTKKLIFDDFDKLFTDVEKETNRKEEENRYYLWTEWYNNWIDLVKWLDELIKEQRYESLFFYRFLELNKQLLWIYKCVNSGAYHTAIRELRFVFESFIQAHYIDKEHPESEMECKLEIIKDKLIFGSKLIDNTKNLENKNELKKLYSELSKYTHSSYEELKIPIKEGKVDTSIIFTYDKELFDKCYIFTNKVMDTIIFVLMSFEKRMIKKIQEDELIKQFLKETNCELSLRLLNKKN
ncbi:MAG: hypothetical protein PHS81_04310 [Candidatus Nanoarchaeia archaeon]|nr:hypothetical protein [Candidatus Nanoarchaeia archaeon]